MALSASTVWEVRSTGSDLNGGGFVPGSGGTDYSQQDAAVLSLSDLACTGSASSSLTSATGGFTANMVGSLIQIASGTNFTAGFYQITARASSTSVTLDRTPATSSSAASGGVGKVGGALATIKKTIEAMVIGNTGWVKDNGTFHAVGVTVSANASSGNIPTWLKGYGTVRGDATRPTVKLTAQVGISLQAGWDIGNVIFDGNAMTFVSPLSLAGNSCYIHDCLFLNAGADGSAIHCNQSGPHRIRRCEFTSWGYFAIQTGGYAGTLSVEECSFHDSLSGALVCQFGVNQQAQFVFRRNLVYNCGGLQAVTFSDVTDNTFCNVAGDGLYLATEQSYPPFLAGVQNNVFALCSGYGLNADTSIGIHDEYNGNAYYACTSGARAPNVGAVSGDSRDVILTANPFVNAAGGDFRPNNAGGAALRGAALPGAFPGLLSVPSNLDMGAYQHATPALGLTVTGSPPVLVWDADSRSTKYDVLGYNGTAYTVLTSGTTSTTYTDNSGAGYTAYTVTGRP